MPVRLFFEGLLQSLDLFSVQIVPLINKQEKFSHLAGQLPSLLVMLLTGYSFFQLTQDLITFSSPRITQNVEANPDPKPYYFSPENFFFSFIVVDAQGTPVVNTWEDVYYIPLLQFCSQISYNLPNGTITDGQQCIPIKTQNCNKSDTLPEFSSNVPENKFNKFICLDKDDWKSKLNYTFIAGNPASQQFAYLTATIIRCQNLSGFNCVSEEKAKSIRSGSFVTTFSDRVLDQNKIGNPYTITTKQLITPYSLNQKAIIRTTYKYSILNSIQNILYYLPAQDQYEDIVISNQVEFLASSDQMIGQILCHLDERTENYQRTYDTLFDVLGNISGLQSILTMIVGILIGPLVKKNMNIHLINQVYQIQEKQPDSQRINSNNLLNFIRQQRKPLRPNIFEIMLCLNRKNSQIFDQGVDKIERSLDISNIVRRLNSIEEIKNYLFNQQQGLLFQFVEQPVIQIRKMDNQRIYYQDSSRLHEEEKPTDIQRGNDFSQLISSQSKCDKKLLMMAINKANFISFASVDQKEQSYDIGEQELVDL